MEKSEQLGPPLWSERHKPSRIRVKIALIGTNRTDGAFSGRRVYLEKESSMNANFETILSKLGIQHRGDIPKLYSRHGVEIKSLEDTIDGELLYFDPFGRPFNSKAPSGGCSAPIPDDLTTSLYSTTTTSIGSGSVVSYVSTRRRRNRKKSGPKSNKIISPESGNSLTISMQESNGSAVKLSKEGAADSISGLGIHQQLLNRPNLFLENTFEYDYLFKFILVGNVAVGKSCILTRFTDDRFHSTHATTLGVDFGTEIIRTSNHKRIKIQIWDTAGQEYFVAVTKTYFCEAAAALLVYDITNRASFDELQRWLDSVRELSTNDSITIVLIGNKSDREQDRKVSEREGLNFARDNALLFIETSALSGDSIREAFTQAAEAVLRKIDTGVIDVDHPSQGVRRGEFAVNKAVASLNPTYRTALNLGDEESDFCYGCSIA